MAKMKFAMNRKHGRQMEMELGLARFALVMTRTRRTSGYFNAASVGRRGALADFPGELEKRKICVKIVNTKRRKKRIRDD